jgi:hypothetical protein
MGDSFTSQDDLIAIGVGYKKPSERKVDRTRVRRKKYERFDDDKSKKMAEGLPLQEFKRVNAIGLRKRGQDMKAPEGEAELNVKPSPEADQYEVALQVSCRLHP